VAQVACVVNRYGKKGTELVPILEMWESYSGWYWFITEYADKKDPDWCFGFVVGLEDEWGYIDKSELRSLRGVWKVPYKNWFSNSHVVMANKEELKV